MGSDFLIFSLSETPEKVYEFDRFTKTALPVNLEPDGDIIGVSFRQIAISKDGEIEVIRF